MSLFRVLFITSLFLLDVILLDVVGIIARTILTVWALYLFWYYYIYNRRMFKVLYHRWLILFILLYIVTCFIHIKANFLGNMLSVVYLIISLFLLYGMHTQRNRKRIHEEVFWVCRIIAVCTLVFAVIGVTLALLNFQGVIVYDFFKNEDFEFTMEYFAIIYKNRFTGLYKNPNIVGFISVVGVVASHMLLKDNFAKHANRKVPNKKFLYVVIAFNLLSLFLSDSNGSILLMILYVVFLVLYKFFRYRSDEELTIKNLSKRFFSFVLISLLIAGVGLGVRSLTQVAFVGTTNLVADIMSSQEGSSGGQTTPTTPDGEEVEEPTRPTYQHENSDIDSGRLELLAQSSVLIGNHPLFGVGHSNINYYGDMYIEDGLAYSDFHNGYLTIIVSSGIVGFILFIAFSLNIFKHTCKSLFYEEKDLMYTVFPNVFAFLCAYCVYAAVDITMLYDATFRMMFFWFMLGYCTMFLSRYEHLDKKLDLSTLFIRSEKNTEKYDVPTKEELE